MASMLARMLAVALPLVAAATEPVAAVPEDGIVGGLAADDACAAGEGDAECSVELRQLRSREKLAAASIHDHHTAPEAKDGSFGLEAVGEDMWSETTWGDVLAEIAATKSNSSVATGTDGACDADTFGTCSVFNCADSRGATQCVKGKCICPSGYCAKAGTCFPKANECLSDTGGTCGVLSCKSSRGKTKCKSGKCLCKTGGCAWKGKCYPVTDTGGSCDILPCSSSRGPTTCHRGRCLCKAGYVAVKGLCEPF